MVTNASSPLDVQRDISVPRYLLFDGEPRTDFGDHSFLLLQQTRHSQQFPVEFQLFVAEREADMDYVIPKGHSFLKHLAPISVLFSCLYKRHSKNGDTEFLQQGHLVRSVSRSRCPLNRPTTAFIVVMMSINIVHLSLLAASYNVTLFVSRFFILIS